MEIEYSKIDFLYLSEDDMVQAAGVKDRKGCVEAMEKMFKLMKVGDYRMGGANGNSHGCMVMFPKSFPFPEMPLDGPDRRFMTMSANILSAYRTRAVPGVGFKTFAREGPVPLSLYRRGMDQAGGNHCI